MGRSRRSKSKVKACDPFCKDIMRVASWRKKAVLPRAPRILADHEKETEPLSKGQKRLQALLERGKQLGNMKVNKKQNKKRDLMERKPAESVRAFLSRVESETKERAVQAVKENSQIREKRKEWFKKRKSLKKEAMRRDSDEEIFNRPEHIEFGDVVDRPPEIKVVPKFRKST